MGKETNNTGRTTGKFKNNRVDDQFIPYTLEMLGSPAMAVLTGVDRRVLDRLCIEHMAHAGTENGNLKCTYDDFRKFGIRRAAVGDSIRRLSALGFIEIICSGRFNKAEFHHPSIYRLTFVLGNIAPTHDWKNVSDIAAAKAIVSRVSTHRKQQSKAAKSRNVQKLLEVKKQKAERVNVPYAGRVNEPLGDALTYPQKPDALTGLPSISRRGGGVVPSQTGSRLVR